MVLAFNWQSVFASAPVEARPRTRPPGDMDYLYKAPVTSFFGSNLVRMPRLLQGNWETLVAEVGASPKGTSSLECRKTGRLYTRRRLSVEVSTGLAAGFGITISVCSFRVLRWKRYPVIDFLE